MELEFVKPMGIPVCAPCITVFIVQTVGLYEVIRILFLLLMNWMLVHFSICQIYLDQSARDASCCEEKV